MKIFFIVLAAVCIGGARSSILEPEQREELKRIRNGCILEAKITPFEIITVMRAVRPAEKFVDASKCIVDKLTVLQHENKNVAEIVERTKLAIQNSDSTKVVNDLISSCQKLLGADTCNKLLDLIGQVVESVHKLKNQA